MGLSKIYNSRNKKLKKAGFDDYKDYLNSKQWRDIKSRITQNKCKFCKTSKRLEMHHISYAKIHLDDARNIFAVCHDCHTNLHILSNAPDIKIKDKSLRSSFREYNKYFYIIKRANRFWKMGNSKEDLIKSLTTGTSKSKARGLVKRIKALSLKMNIFELDPFYRYAESNDIIKYLFEPEK